MTLTLTVELTDEQADAIKAFPARGTWNTTMPMKIALRDLGLSYYYQNRMWITTLGKQAREQLKKAVKDAVASRAPKIDEPY